MERSKTADMKNLLILSDIHGNLTALSKVLEHVDLSSMDGIVLLGDLIDYGPRSNEVIDRIKEIDTKKILVNIWGNHEQAVMENRYERFSSTRGKVCAQHTKSELTEQSLAYLRNMNPKGWQEFQTGDKHCLAVHGSLEDVFWRSIDFECPDERYAGYDYVFCGHSHIPSCMEKFYESDNVIFRNKKKTVFLNPGSVGQPRNHNPNANFAVLDVENGTVTMHSLEYDYQTEMKMFSDQVDDFYRVRLEKGI